MSDPARDHERANRAVASLIGWLAAFAFMVLWLATPRCADGADLLMPVRTCLEPHALVADPLRAGVVRVEQILTSTYRVKTWAGRYWYVSATNERSHDEVARGYRVATCPPGWW